MEFRRRKGRGNTPEERRGGKGVGVLQREKETSIWVFHLEGFYLLSKGRDFRAGTRGRLITIFMNSPGAAFPGSSPL